MSFDYGLGGVNCRCSNITENYKVEDLVNAYNQISFDATKDELNGAVLGAEIANLEFAIDKAIDAGDRYTFLALSGQLKELLAKVGEADEV
ncbi:hypothetical protein FH508_0008530 [Lysinibacillus sp. CD3-6]|uniref:hypothetical protein n=1 Tax=Lysinibacillus sp. CD3-6 TaxID=2892541 RepID=UPI00111CA6ED|nr:hypothetical protein [Lysinibacillus sp. CD3-6]UED81926.1 hypothetical protein FH508_0008530 [Lysinibacillus sp. CD3-6]